MAEITWTAEAERWLQDIFEYIALDSAEAAGRTIQGIYDRAQDLVWISRDRISLHRFPSSRTHIAVRTLPYRVSREG